MGRRRAVLVALALGTACTVTRLPEVDADLVRAGASHGASAADLVRGRELLLGTCTACHGAVHPRALTRAGWGDVLPRMLRHAKLTAADGAAIEAFVAAVGPADG